MSWRVEPRPAADSLALWVDLLRATRETPPDPRLIEWRYVANPHGAAHAWVLVNSATGDIGGFTVALPRRMSVNGHVLTAWVGADFSILPRCRALGPALMLRRAAREAIDNGEADLLFSFPNVRMALIHERAGHVRLGSLTRSARPVSTRPFVAKTLRSTVGAAIVAPPIDLARRVAFALRARQADCVREVDGSALDARLGALTATVSRNGRLIGHRDGAYLRWRFLDRPGWAGGMLVAERGGASTGYIVYALRGRLLHIEDILAVDDVACRGLVRGAAAVAARCGCASVSYTGLERGTVEPILRRLGFRDRMEDHAVYAYVPERHAGLVSSSDPSRWHLTVGDRDI